MPDHPRMKHAIKLAGVASAVLLATSCVTVSAPAPTSQLAVADAAISDAVSADAPRYDAANLNNAQRKLARAHDEVAQGDYADAHDLAEEAEVDARLAATRARAAKAAAAAASVQASVRALHDEITRSPQ